MSSSSLSNALLSHLQRSGTVDQARAQMRAQLVAQLRGRPISTATAASIRRTTDAMGTRSDCLDAAAVAHALARAFALGPTEAVLDAEMKAACCDSDRPSVNRSAREVQSTVERWIHAACPQPLPPGCSDTAGHRLLIFLRRAGSRHPSESGMRDVFVQTEPTSALEQLDQKMDAVARQFQRKATAAGEDAASADKPESGTRITQDEIEARARDKITVELAARTRSLESQLDARLQQSLDACRKECKSQVERNQIECEQRIAAMRTQVEKAESALAMQRESYVRKLDALRIREQSVAAAEDSLQEKIRRQQQSYSNQLGNLKSRESDVDRLEQRFQSRQSAIERSIRGEIEAEMREQRSRVELLRAEADEIVQSEKERVQESQQQQEKYEQLSDLHASICGKYDACRDEIQRLHALVKSKDKAIIGMQEKLPQAAVLMRTQQNNRILSQSLVTISRKLKELKLDLQEVRAAADGSFETETSILSSVIESVKQKQAALLTHCKRHKKAAADIEDLMDRQKLAFQKQQRDLLQQVEFYKRKQSDAQAVNESLKASLKQLSSLLVDAGIHAE